MLKIPVICDSAKDLPCYATKLAAGADVRAKIESDHVLAPMERALIPTGLFFEIPAGYEIQVRPRSGLALKHGITVLNAPGTVDADYRGELKVILINLGEKHFAIEPGMRVAQLVLAKVTQGAFSQVEELATSERGSGGFGHTGV